jgi:biofilm PGA synthesis N-glycosyltransferase PgaC
MKDKIINTRYVLITAARNEEAYIEKTIQSVISQTILPKKWVIISDGSTDRTDEIVKRYQANYDFIQLLRMELDTNRNYGRRVDVMLAGVERLNGIEYDFIGNLDADVSFEPNYYESIIVRFQANSNLGIAGGRIFDKHRNGFRRQFASVDSVAGAIQMFRWRCYEEIGGLTPSTIGGVDAIAEITARMKGWQVRSFSDLKIFHHRQTGIGTGSHNIWHARLNGGIIQYSVGYHWLFVLARSLYKIFQRPYLLGSILTLCGFCWANLQKKERVVPDEVMQYLRREQLHKLLSLFSKNIDTNGTPV